MTSKSKLCLDWQRSLKQDPTKISFLDLPRELRDMVYEDALVVPTILSASCTVSNLAAQTPDSLFQVPCVVPIECHPNGFSITNLYTSLSWTSSRDLILTESGKHG